MEFTCVNAKTMQPLIIHRIIRVKLIRIKKTLIFVGVFLSILHRYLPCMPSLQQEDFKCGGGSPDL